MNQGIKIVETRTLHAEVRVGDTGITITANVVTGPDGNMVMNFENGAYAVIVPGKRADFYDSDGRGELEYPTVYEPVEVLKHIITDMMVPHLAKGLTLS